MGALNDRMATATIITSAEFLARSDAFDDNGNQRHGIPKSNIVEALIVRLHAGSVRCALSV